ncbi:MAG: chemotaxis protein CheW [Nitrospirota bacterium]|nr:chemotaxis protein CheW [Nitrospirota bacterium]
MRKEEYLKVLGLPARSSLDDIKRARRSLLMKNHPDLNPETPVAAQRRTQQILEAYDALMRMWNEPAPSTSYATETTYTAPAPQGQKTPETRRRSYLTFRIGDVSLALDALEVREIIPLNRLLQESGISAMPNRVLWRGRSTILVDPRRALRIACTETALKAKVIVATCAGEPIGLIVDDVGGINKIAESDIKGDATGTSIPQSLCKGVICTDGNRTPLLALEKMLTF